MNIHLGSVSGHVYLSLNNYVMFCGLECFTVELQDDNSVN